MRALYIAYYTILRNIRDYSNLFNMLALPIVLIFILGSSLSGSFQIENIEPIKVILINESNGKLSEAFENFLDSKDVKKIITTEKINAFDKGIEKLKYREAALIHLKNDFKGEINIYASDLSAFKSSVVRNVLDSFIQGANTKYAVNEMGEIITDIPSYENIKEEALNADGKKPRAIDYYAVSMLIMTIMYGTMHGSTAMAEEQYYKTEIRLKSAPMAQYEIYVGKVAGTIFTLMLDGAIIILFTKYAYGVDWGKSILSILFTCFSLAVMAAGLGVASFMLIRNENKAYAFLSILVPVFTFLGGGYIPMQYMSPMMEKLSFISPNYLGQKIMLNTIFGGSTIQIKNYLSVLWIESFAFFMLSALLGRKDLA